MSESRYSKSHQPRSPLLACAVCGVLRGYPRPVCAVCHAKETRHVALPARGTLYSLTTIYRAPTASLAAKVPYTIGLIQGARGGLLLLTLVGFGANLPSIGTAVLICEGKGATGEPGLIAAPFYDTTLPL